MKVDGKGASGSDEEGHSGEAELECESEGKMEESKDSEICSSSLETLRTNSVSESLV
jgi:hypothetical protein